MTERGAMMSEHYKHLLPTGSPKFRDRGVTKASELFKSWQGEEVTGLGMIGLPLSKPSISQSGASLAPDAIRKSLSSYSSYAIEEEIDLSSHIVFDLGDVAMHVTDLLESHNRIEKTLSAIYKQHPRLTPIILGGDHSVSCPSIKAFARHKGKVGVIQFDAHHDLRNLEDGGPSNGTPFRGLIETGAIEGKHLYQIGIRNFSNGKMYHDYAIENGVHVYTMKDVREKSIIHILDECLQGLQGKVDTIYISLDMDVLDQAFAPGCPAIGPGGMDSDTLLRAIQYLGTKEEVQALDIVEIDPTLDIRDMTSRVAAHVILNFLLSKKA